MKDEPSNNTDFINSSKPEVITSSEQATTDVDISPQQAPEKPCSCRDKEGMETSELNPTFIYAIGRIECRFPSASVEQEYVQVTGETKTTGQSDPEVKQSVLSAPENRYLAREMCWLLVVDRVETYILVPRYREDFDLLLRSLRTTPGTTDLDIVIGVLGPIASPRMCGGRPLPIVVFDHIYSDSRDNLLKIIPKPENISAKAFTNTANQILDWVLQMTDNVGATDKDRALNYLAVRFDEIYRHTSEMNGKDFSLKNIEVRPSPVSAAGERDVDVILSYAHRTRPVEEKSLVRVNMGKFPFVKRWVPDYVEI